jgi:protein-S-isoprenylcysteine O-methyltransferase Ste14
MNNLLREDIWLIIPSLLIGIIQIKFLWGNLPFINNDETKRFGAYSEETKDKLYFLIYLAYFILIIQLSFPLLTISVPNSGLNVSMIILGYLLITYGFISSYIALANLKDNWTGLIDYRIKKNQTLVTSGIYKFVRHPIYGACILEMVGYELVSRSWLFLVVLITSFLFMNWHIKNEEELLEENFPEYKEYKNRTKKFFPLIY